MAKAQASETRESREESTDSPLLDTMGAAVKKMVTKGKERGYVTYDELNAALPPEEVSSEQIEDTMAMLSEMGINVVENEEQEEAANDTPANDEEEPREKSAAGNVDESDLGRTDDPVRMYLREMGSVELLSREGEIAIAKRIEAGRDMLIGGICESPLTIQAIVRWHDALIAGEILLREIIDLDATLGGGPGQPPKPGEEENSDDDNTENKDGAATPATAKPAGEAKKTTSDDDKKDGENGEESKTDDDDDEDDDEQNNLSLAALEEKLKPEVIETFEEIAKTYKKFQRLQTIRMEAMQGIGEFKSSQENRYAKLRQDLIELMEDVHLSNDRIEAHV